MLLQCLHNLITTLYSLILTLWYRVPGWRYPLVDYIEKGRYHSQTEKTVETIGFNTLKHHRVMTVLKKLSGDFVIVVSIHHDHLRFNVYRVVMDTMQSDLHSLTNGTPGINGQYHYLLSGGVLYHALRPTTWTQQRGFFISEPIMSYQLFITERQKRELSDLMTMEERHPRGATPFIHLNNEDWSGGFTEVPPVIEDPARI